MSDLFDKLVEYTDSDYYPFHMPGHKRNIKEGINPYSYDITEIEGFDNLHEPQGVLRLAMEEAAKFYESDKTYFLVNGSTCGLLSAICGVTAKNDKILVARNCHKSVYNAIYLNELMPVYVYPEYIEGYGINGGISPYKVEYLLEENKDIRVVVITSPTYEGVVSDIEKIAQAVHRRNGILIVDEAHGAHFGMHPGFPRLALSQGADVVIHSLHKTLPALTQTALLHIKSDRVDELKEKIERYLHIYQTSSPSYVLMASITECINRIKKEGMLLFEAYVRRLKVISEHARELTHVRLLNRDIVGKNSVADFDISKLVISMRGTGYTGKWLYEQMLDRFHLQLEMCAGDYALAMTSLMDTEEGLLRLFKAMVEIDRDIRVYGNDSSEKFEGKLSNLHIDGSIASRTCDMQGYKNDRFMLTDYRLPAAVVPKKISEALTEKSVNTEELALHLAEGKISVEYVYLYPPGVPIVAPGELITGEIINVIKKYKQSGLEIHGTSWKNADRIRVVKEGFRSVNLIRGFV